ncbi:hypothetical protein FQZ97_887070 [compost metagenome]
MLTLVGARILAGAAGQLRAWPPAAMLSKLFQLPLGHWTSAWLLSVRTVGQLLTVMLPTALALAVVPLLMAMVLPAVRVPWLPPLLASIRPRALAVPTLPLPMTMLPLALSTPWLPPPLLTVMLPSAEALSTEAAPVREMLPLENNSSIWMALPISMSPVARRVLMPVMEALFSLTLPSTLKCALSPPFTSMLPRMSRLPLMLITLSQGSPGAGCPLPPGVTANTAWMVEVARAASSWLRRLAVTL